MISWIKACYQSYLCQTIKLIENCKNKKEVFEAFGIDRSLKDFFFIQDILS